MNKKALIGIGIGAIAVGIFLLALTNPNLRENKETYFGFIETGLTVDCAELWDDMYFLRDNGSQYLGEVEIRERIEKALESQDIFYTNWCAKNVEEWEHRSQSKTLNQYRGPNTDESIWQQVINGEWNYNNPKP